MAKRQLDAARDEAVCDVACVWHGTRKAVQLGDDQRVAITNGGKRLIQPRSCPVRAGQAVIRSNGVEYRTGQDRIIRCFADAVS